MAGFDLEGDHLCQGKSDAETAEDGEADALTLRAQDGLTDEVEDGSLRGMAQDGGVEEAADGIGSLPFGTGCGCLSL
ncbi:hypothetical protein [Tunturiibacter gelidoferens]|uniref:Uncharacterized protein n=1 Tax=Tunturiibacter gelidiferens TaxID=3069689 RepID=A0ACC5P3W1_9BACT|nr:hypothetical protein [Edaphobacter lichenicola]MBB5341497.1 hypothetical protein [Edaphobacter lichenicola]